MDKTSENITNKMPLEVEIKGDDPILMLGKEEMNAQEGESLEDQLKFEAQVLASNRTWTADSEPLGSSEKLIHGMNKEEGASKDDIVLASHDYYDIAGSGSRQQGHYLSIDSVSIHEERIEYLESELASLKQMFATQTELYLAAQHASKKPRRTGKIGLVVALVALGVSFWSSFSTISKQLESGEPQQIVLDIDDHLVDLKVDLQIDANEDSVKKQIEDSPNENRPIEPDIIRGQNTLILPEDDIAGSKTANVSEAVSHKDNSPMLGWAVNLNSYEQRWKTDKKMQELQQKGIPAEVVVVNVKGVKWFRIRETGFKTKAEAESYAASIHKTLDENHTWISKI